jgi:hypothetical protein
MPTCSPCSTSSLQESQVPRSPASPLSAPPTFRYALFHRNHCQTIADSFSPQSESVLIQKIYTHFKKTPGTHKLGVLYVVDSVTRQWVDQAKKNGQTPGSGAPDGTFAAGVTRVTELLPVLMNDIIATAPEDQKVRSTRSWQDEHTSVPSERRIAAWNMLAVSLFCSTLALSLPSYGSTHVL